MQLILMLQNITAKYHRGSLSDVEQYVIRMLRLFGFLFNPPPLSGLRGKLCNVSLPPSLSVLVDPELQAGASYG